MRHPHSHGFIALQRWNCGLVTAPVWGFKAAPPPWVPWAFPQGWPGPYYSLLPGEHGCRSRKLPPSKPIRSLQPMALQPHEAQDGSECSPAHGKIYLKHYEIFLWLCVKISCNHKITMSQGNSSSSSVAQRCQKFGQPCLGGDSHAFKALLGRGQTPITLDRSCLACWNSVNSFSFWNWGATFDDLWITFGVLLPRVVKNIVHS